MKTKALKKLVAQATPGPMNILAVSPNAPLHQLSLLCTTSLVCDVAARQWHNGKVPHRLDVAATANAKLIQYAFNNILPMQEERDLLQEAAEALELLSAHYDDISKSNPGFMGKLCLKNYKLWNESLLATEVALAKLKARKSPARESKA